MKLKEAYQTLGLSENANEEEVKKTFRKLAAKSHPDVNKEPDAEDKFKKINQAYQVIQHGEEPEPGERLRQSQNPFGHYGNPFDFINAQHSTIHPAENINVSIALSFKESVLGCKKDIKFSRNIKCQECNGEGEKHLNNGCEKCGGKGQIVGKQGNMIFTRTCDKCFGRSRTEPCMTCSTKGIMESETSVNVSIPGGIQDSSVLRLGGMGHFVGSSFMFADQHTDVHLRVSVVPEAGLSINGTNVVSILEISLLEALQGCNKKVKTIEGQREIQVVPLSKNREEIVIPKLGVNGTGDHKIILDVKYPKKIDSLVETLSKGNN